jgi:Fe-S cluster assembly protein SufD
MGNARALERYRALPVPSTTEEAWRFTDLRGFDPDSYSLSPNGSTAAPPERLLELDVAGLAVVTESGIEIEQAPEGIRFEPLTEDDPRLYSLVPWNEKFAAHNAAVWQHGLLVEVPAGVELSKPLYVRVASSIGGTALVWRLLVVAGEGSRFTLIEDYGSAGELDAYSNAVAELFVEQGAKLEYVSIQNLSRNTWHFATHHARVERDGVLDWVAGGFGSKKGKIRIQNDLNGPGATSRVTGAYFADGEQHLDYDTFQEHIAPSTESDFAFKGALRERARAVWRGMIRVEEDAQRTNAYQENRNLLLSPDAHADSIPGLEIMANDVRCTHGATLGRVNREELFYLMARGLSRAEAERLIVRGFFQDILDRIELEPVREALGAALEARIPEA